MLIYWAMTAIPVIFAICMDANLIETGLLAGMDDGGVCEFYCQMLAVIVTLLSIPVALKLFKFKNVATALREQPEAKFQCYAILRMAMLELPLLINLVCYYLFANPSFFHLGILTIISFVFIYPSMNRCLFETGKQAEE